MNRQFLRAVLPLSLFVSSVVPVIAQAPPAPQAPYRPPAIRFDASGMTLLDAIRLTLQNDPTIKLRETDVALQQGILRSQKGLFDSTFRADGSFGRDQTELLESEKQDQLETRDDLATAIVEVTALTHSLTAAGALLAGQEPGLQQSGRHEPVHHQGPDRLQPDEHPPVGVDPLQGHSGLAHPHRSDGPERHHQSARADHRQEHRLLQLPAGRDCRCSRPAADQARRTSGRRRRNSGTSRAT